MKFVINLKAKKKKLKKQFLIKIFICSNVKGTSLKKNV